MAFPTQSADLEASSSQYFSRADDALLELGTSFTLETWIKPEGYGGKILGKRSIGQRSYQLILSGTDPSNSAFNAQLSSDGTSNFYDTGKTVAISTGTWYHMGFTFSGSGLANEVKFYVNGTQTGTTDAAGGTGVFSGTSAFAIGCENPSGTPGDFFDGRQVLTRVWKGVVRTEAEIAASMCTLLGTTTGLSGEWSLDNTLNDNSGNSLTLTNNNSVTFGADVPSICAVSGPANLKSLDTNLKANIKSYNTNPLANIKSINTNA
jgi:hypothetical protein